MSIEKEIQTAMEATLNSLKEKLKGLRTGRANAAILDNVMVDVYGTMMRIKSLANITVPEPRQILVTPFDASNLSAIVKGIESANLNLHAQVDGKFIRINVPPMDEAIRKKIVAECKKLVEDTKIALREVRRKFNDLIRKKKSDGEITEDELKREEKIIQNSTDKYCKLCDETGSAKEKDILSI